MEYRIELFGATMPAHATLDALLEEEDASAVSDLDRPGRVWRVNTVLAAEELRALLARVGCRVEAAQVRPLPSVCCGGCSG